MRHIGTIARRELSSLFVSPVAYVVLTLWSVIAGTFFLASVLGFSERLMRAQQYQAFQAIEEMNLNDHLIEPFIGSMWVILLFLLPAITMGLIASEKNNGTDELLLTCPISIWDIVLGKFVAGCGFVLLTTAIVAFFPGILFIYGDPEVGKTLCGLLAILLVSISYVAIGVFASSVTRNQLIAFMLTLVLLLVIGMMLPFVVDISMAGSGLASDSGIAESARWLSTGLHIDRMLQGLIDTSDLAYYAIVCAGFLLVAKTVVETARWRA